MEWLLFGMLACGTLYYIVQGIKAIVHKIKNKKKGENE